MEFESTSDQALATGRESNLSIRYGEMHKAVYTAVRSMEVMFKADRRWPTEITKKLENIRMRSFDDDAVTLHDYDMANEEQFIDSFAAESKGESAPEGSTVSMWIDFEGYGKILFRLVPLGLICKRKFQSDDALLDLLAVKGPYSPQAFWDRFLGALKAMWRVSSLQKDEPVEKALKEVWEAWNRLQASATDARKVIESEGQNPRWVQLKAGKLCVLPEFSSSKGSALSLDPTNHDPVLVQVWDCSDVSQEGCSKMRDTLDDFIHERTAPRPWLRAPTEQEWAEWQSQIDRQKIAFLESAKALLGLLELRSQEGKDRVEGFGNTHLPASNALTIADSKLGEEEWQGGKSVEGFEAAKLADDQAFINADRMMRAEGSQGGRNVVKGSSSGIENLSGNEASTITSDEAENVWGLGVMLPPAGDQTTIHKPGASAEEASLCMLHPQTKELLTTNGKRNFIKVDAGIAAKLSEERRRVLQGNLSLLVSLLHDDQSSGQSDVSTRGPDHSSRQSTESQDPDHLHGKQSMFSAFFSSLC